MTDPLEQARRDYRTRRTLRDIADYDPQPYEFLSLSSLDISDAIEQATLDYLKGEAATVHPIADRRIDRDDLREMGRSIRRAGYNDVLVFHPATVYAEPIPYETHSWDHDGLAIAVAPDALTRPPSMDRALGRANLTAKLTLQPAWLVADPRGVSVAERVATDFEWGPDDG